MALMIRLFVLFQCALFAGAFQQSSLPSTRRTPPATSSTSSEVVVLQMGLLDMAKDFLQNREGDFVKLEDLEDGALLGPLVLFYNVPETIDNGELADMLSDGAPAATKTGIAMERINNKAN
eukprot:scaffold18353_cov54-Cylindrotheca_fusiformis.AAC.1